MAKLLNTPKRVHDWDLRKFQIRSTAKLCVALICTIQVISRLITYFWDPASTPTGRKILLISVPFAAVMTLIICIEYLLFKKKGASVVKYSSLVDIILLIIFIGDWITILLASLYKVEGGSSPCFRIAALFGLTTFSWRTLLVTLIVQKWQLKIIAPILAICVAAGWTMYYTPSNIGFLLLKTATSLFNVFLIVYCEDKVKTKLLWTNFQQEKWMQVNNFILNNMPENIMILDVAGEVKFINDYCRSFMKQCKILGESSSKELFEKIQDLQQQQYDRGAMSIIQMERMTTGNGFLLNENNEQNLLKVDALKDLIESFKRVIINKALQERQFLVYNGKLKMDHTEQNKSIEIKISFIQHYENDSIILIFRDTTQRDLLVALEETNRYKDQLLASVSHELRAPLNGNINLVESAVNSSKIPEEIKESLLVPALRSSKFLLHIINDILDMSQIKEKKLRLVFQSGDLKDTLKSTAQLVELQAKKKGIQLQLEIDPNLPKSFCTDHLRLSQIVLNLLNNAMKFTQEGMVKMIAIPVKNTNWVEIGVEDSGIGMSQENLKKLFAHYTHIEFEGRQIMNPTGVGLGLNIAHNLAELLAPQGHQGINVVSVPNQGSTFKFVIENKQKAEDFNSEIAEERPGVIKPIFKTKINRNNSMKRECTCAKVLIVDDNPFNTMAFETILGSLEVKCDSVYSGSSAIKKIMNREENKCSKNCKSYVLVFMDQEMPEMSGAEAVREIRRLQGEKIVPRMKIIGCTAHQSKEEVEKFLEAGLDLCIHKPISTIMIKDILKKESL